MSFEREAALEDETAQRIYGEYVSTFRSQNKQVLAQLFKRDDQLVAHVSFPTGLKPEKVTDAYISDLNKFANGRGFTGRLKIIYHYE
jgi:hypothetical protein